MNESLNHYTHISMEYLKFIGWDTNNFWRIGEPHLHLRMYKLSKDETSALGPKGRSQGSRAMIKLSNHNASPLLGIHSSKWEYDQHYEDLVLTYRS